MQNLDEFVYGFQWLIYLDECVFILEKTPGELLRLQDPV